MSLQNPNKFAARLCILLGIAISVGLSVPLTAYLGSLFGDTYNQRVMIYGGLLLWLIAGSACILYVTENAPERRATAGFLALCFLSIWLWPIVLTMHLLRSQKRGH